MTLRVALPSKGELETPTLGFLAEAGLRVRRPNQRQYVASIPSVGAEAIFQRASDIAGKVAEGSADIGIAGFDTIEEARREGDGLVVVHEGLGFGQADLVLAVPDSWVDVSSLADLAELAADFRDRGRTLRIATKFPRLTQRFLLRARVGHFAIVESKGAMEAAPAMGYADMIADLTATGTTLRENRLKTLAGGEILRSQTCIVGNAAALRADPAKLATVRTILERIEARLRGGDHFRLTANIRGETEQAVAARIWERPELAGMSGPTVSRVYTAQGARDGVFAVALVVRGALLLPAVDHLRASGGSGVSVTPVSYVFEEACAAYDALVQRLGSA